VNSQTNLYTSFGKEFKWLARWRTEYISLSAYFTFRRYSVYNKVSDMELLKRKTASAKVKKPYLAE
jgi:hypothetical protein